MGRKWCVVYLFKFFMSSFSSPFLWLDSVILLFFFNIPIILLNLEIFEVIMLFYKHIVVLTVVCCIFFYFTSCDAVYFFKSFIKVVLTSKLTNLWHIRKAIFFHKCFKFADVLIQIPQNICVFYLSKLNNVIAYL